MKVIINEKLIKRNGRIGQIATISGLLVLVGGIYISFRSPNYGGYAWVALLVGFAFSQIGLYYGNRWGRRPRPDELIDEGLKGLNDQYSIYHYITPAAHLLVGPSGLWVLMPYYQVGKIVYEKGRWKQKGGGFFQRYLRVFAQEGMGRPDIEAPGEAQAVMKYINKRIPEKDVPDPKLALVFTNDKVDLDVKNAPILTLPLKKLKAAVRKVAKEKPISTELIQEINEMFT